MKKWMLLSVCFLLFSTAQAQTTAQDWYDKGTEETDWELKIAYFSKAIRIDPSFGNAYSYRGMALQELNRDEEAIKDFDKAIELQAPYGYIDFNNRGVSKKKLKRYEEAILDYNKAIQLKPDYAAAFYNRGLAKRTLNRLDDAILDYDKAIKIKPDYAFAYNNRGVAEELLGRLQEAQADYRKALSFDPNDETYKTNLKNLQAKLPVAPPPAPRIWAVAVGISRYQYETHLTRLDFPSQQAYEFVRFVERKDFIDNEVPVLVDGRAGRDAILSTLRNTFVYNSAVGPDDMVIFYYSGHGMAVGDKIGICPYDYFDQGQLITDEDILDILSRCKARHKLCVVEACKTKVNAMSPIPASAKDRFNEQRKNVKGGVVYITSTRAGDESYEYPDIGGVFSYYFLKGIKGAADTDGDRTVMANELFNYIQSNVGRYTNQRQQPQINADGNRAIPLMVVD